MDVERTREIIAHVWSGLIFRKMYGTRSRKLSVIMGFDYSQLEGSTWQSHDCGPQILDLIGILKSWKVERGEPEFPEKPQGEERINYKFNPHDTGSGNQTRESLVEGKISPYCTTPTLLKNEGVCLIQVWLYNLYLFSFHHAFTHFVYMYLSAKPSLPPGVLPLNTLYGMQQAGLIHAYVSNTHTFTAFILRQSCPWSTRTHICFCFVFLLQPMPYGYEDLQRLPMVLIS